MKRLIFSLLIGLWLCPFNSLIAQSLSQYYVNVKALNIYSEASTNAKVIQTLQKYDNLLILEKISGKELVKVRYKETEGYVSAQSILKGKAVTTIQSIRTGAICRDGTQSSATGRGACSHHGGVKEWRYKKDKRVSIIKN